VYAKKMETFSRIFSVLGELTCLARALFTDGMHFIALCGRSRTALDEDASNDILVDLDAKRLRYDQRDPRTAKAGIAVLEFNDGTNECVGRTFRPRFRSLLRREEPAVLAAHQALVEIQQG